MNGRPRGHILLVVVVEPVRLLLTREQLLRVLIWRLDRIQARLVHLLVVTTVAGAAILAEILATILPTIVIDVAIVFSVLVLFLLDVGEEFLRARLVVFIRTLHPALVLRRDEHVARDVAGEIAGQACRGNALQQRLLVLQDDLHGVRVRQQVPLLGVLGLLMVLLLVLVELQLLLRLHQMLQWFHVSQIYLKFVGLAEFLGFRQEVKLADLFNLWLRRVRLVHVLVDCVRWQLPPAGAVNHWLLRAGRCSIRLCPLIVGVLAQPW